MNKGSEPRSVRFRRERETEWHDLDRLTTVALKGGLARLAVDELERLPRLYRSALSSLAVARRTAMDRTLVTYLEGLSSRAYLVMYGARRSRPGVLMRFIFEDFPGALRRMGPELLLAFAFTALGVVVAFGLAAKDPDWFYAFIDPAYASGRDPQATTAALRATLYDGGGKDGLTVFAAYLFSHNARIGMMAFALGFVAGVPTALLMFINGTVLGAFLSLFHSRGLLMGSLGWLLPHGVPEITAIVLCGAAGFHLGRAVVTPGPLRVRDSLVFAGRRASIVVMGAVFLFAYAGLVEGIFRQSVTDDGLRFIFAGFNAFWVFGWVLLAPMLVSVTKATTSTHTDPFDFAATDPSAPSQADNRGST